MTTIKAMRELGDKNIAISRDDARRLEPLLRSAAQESDCIVLDTGGLLRLGLGFVDETMLILLKCRAGSAGPLTLTIRPPPQTPSFRNMASHRGLTLEADDEQWRLTAP